MPTQHQPRKRGRPRNSDKPGKSCELLDELARLGCDREYVQLVAGTLAHWEWGTEKWHPPNRSKIASLTEAGRLLEKMKTDFFLRHLWMKADEQSWEQRITESQIVLNECEIGILLISELFQSKPHARRYILIRALIEHLKAKTGQPRFAIVAKLLTQLSTTRSSYDPHKLQIEYKRAQQFCKDFELSQQACAAFQERSLRGSGKLNPLEALQVLLERS